MPDLVVTVPKWFWPDWIAEGDAAGATESGEEWAFFLNIKTKPPVLPGERLYIVAHDRLRGYAPVVRVVHTDRGWAICRKGGAVACTIKEPVRGFQGWRYRWWRYDMELPFADWRSPQPQLL